MLTPDRPPFDQDSGAIGAELNQASKVLPVVIQVVGLAILISAAWSAFRFVENVAHFISAPESQGPVIEGIVKTLKLDENLAPEKPGDDLQLMTMHFSRVLALILLFAGNFLGGILCISLASAGGRMALGGLLEKREVLKAMRDFLSTMRAENGRKQ